ncbi:MAG TPA: amino acid adenylation domain-containing protein [Candidatus Saccharimonadales bacterium]|nr:amino acid adenylation domain-containing protein [Candidatus Saccharimonadales bacterium]
MHTALAIEPEEPIREEAGELLPLSFAQQRLWFLDQLHPCSALYNVPTAFRIGGLLNIEALKRSLEIILLRHEALRTVYLFTNDSPAQRVLDRFAFDLPLTDLSRLSDPEGELGRRLRKEACQPFDLAKDLMLRALLFKLGPAEHVLFLNVHHIAFDEWSLEILLRELAACYSAFCEGQEPSLPELPIQYADFALWQRQQVAGKELEYWTKQLGGELPRLELPTDRTRPAIRTYEGAREYLALSPELTAALKAFSRREAVTLHVLLLAAFQTLLHRYSGQEEIIIGTPVAGRGQLQTEPLIGFFVNTLALRTSFADDPAFKELLVRVRDVNLQALANQDFPFEQIVERLRPERGSNQNPLFDVVFALQNQAALEPEFAGLKFNLIDLSTNSAKFDLTFVVQDKKDTLHLALEYSTEILDGPAMRRMAGHFQTLLAGIVANPLARISQLPILTPVERRQIVEDWNRTTTAYPRDKTVHTLFEEQAARSPSAVAVVYGSEEVTYQELNERSSQLANHLRKLGVGPDTLVGVLMDRSVEMIIAWLAILKAGGAYVPLDLDYPGERLAFMVEDTRMPVVLTKSTFRKRMPAETARLVCLDSDWKTIEREEKAISPAAVTAENLAYVIYTSGSTGKPKGAAIVHRGITRLVFETNYIQLSSAERIAQLSNSSFDAATFEVWGALLHGGRLIGVARETLLSPADFAAFLEKEKVSSLFLTVALFNQISTEAPLAFKSVKNLLAGGDAVDPKAAQRILQCGPPARLVNGYGPTESTTFAVCYEIKEVPENAASIPIGRPISNTTVYILDRHLQPVPVGVPGELHLGGDGLARGYLNRPDLTAAKFIPNPFAGEPGARLYKTGDLARFLPDGNVEFLGRIDHQVKIRGFRIELGEIESVLRQCPGVRDALVIVTEESPGDKRLIGYLCRTAKDTSPPSALRAFLKQKLPDYMVPSVFIDLDAFPLTPNGKIDRRALPKPGSIRNADADVPPQTHLQSQLQKIWEQVLGHQAFGPRDNFFEIGGHSLLAVQLIAQIEKVLGIKLPLPILFQAPTVEKLAEMICQEGAPPCGSSLVEIQPHGARLPMFWLHTLGGGGGGGFFTYRKLANLLGTDQPSYGFVAPAQPLTTIESMAAHYIQEMRAIQPAGPYQLGGYCFGGVVAYEMARQLEAQSETVSLLALLDSSPPDLTGERTRPGAKLAIHFLKTLPFWLTDMAAQGPGPMWKMIRNSGLGLKRKLHRVLKRRAAVTSQSATASKLEELIDMSNYPPAYKQFAQVHWNALMNYDAKPIEGRAILFRTDERHLLRLDAVSAWRKLVRGGLEVKRVTGRHEEILDAPHVEPLAAHLKERMA